MAQIIEFARLRLKGSSPVGPHPDENLLTAFVEGSLTEHLRTRVLRHMSACPSCRGLVSISRPEVIDTAEQPVAARWSWLRWPSSRWASLRWTGAMATAAILLGIAWAGRMELTTIFLPAHVQTAMAGAGGSKNETDRFATHTPATEGVTGSGSQRLAMFSASAAKPVTAVDSHQTSPVITARVKPAAGPIAISPAPEEPAANMFNTSIEISGNREVASPFSAAGLVNHSWSALISPEKISTPVAAPSAASGYSPSDTLRHSKWMVSQSGVLYQSFDNGVRWQSVAVRENVELRSVSSAGDNIWVGGNGGSLFYSGDAGRHWTQVAPSYNGITLTDDIERVEFADADHGSVTTVSGKTWVTADHGETWETR